MRGEIRMRRRVVAVGTVLSALAIALTFNVMGGGAAPVPPRQHIVLQKVCPVQKFSPTFLVSNVTDDPSISNDKKTYGLETLTVYITKGSKAPHEIEPKNVGVGYIAKVVVDPGQTVKVTTPADTPWVGPHFAHFVAEYRGETKLMSSR